MSVCLCVALPLTRSVVRTCLQAYYAVGGKLGHAEGEQEAKAVGAAANEEAEADVRRWLFGWGAVESGHQRLSLTDRPSTHTNRPRTSGPWGRCGWSRRRWWIG